MASRPLAGFADRMRDLKAAGKAFVCFRKAAELGHIEAQFRMGMVLADTKSGRFADRQALGWFRKAAEMGHLEAQFRLGEWLLDDYERLGGSVGSDESVDPVGLLAEAIKWFRCAAFRGNIEAQLFLIRIDDEQQSLDEDEVVRWLRMAAGQGNSKAQYLGHYR